MSLTELLKSINPDIIVPEIEAIRTEKLYDYEKKEFRQFQSAKAANFR